MIITVGEEHRVPPEDAQRELQQHFPELRYSWMPKAKRWAVVREVPWSEVESLVRQGVMSELDIDLHLKYRHQMGYLGPGDKIAIHAFTVRGRNGEYVEPGSWVIEALKRADVQNTQNYTSVRKALWDTIDKVRERERELERMQSEAIADAVESRRRQFEYLPMVHYDKNPISRDDESGKAESGQGSGS